MDGVCRQPLQHPSRVLPQQGRERDLQRQLHPAHRVSDSIVWPYRHARCWRWLHHTCTTLIPAHNELLSLNVLAPGHLPPLSVCIRLACCSGADAAIVGDPSGAVPTATTSCDGAGTCTCSLSPMSSTLTRDGVSKTGGSSSDCDSVALGASAVTSISFRPFRTRSAPFHSIPFPSLTRSWIEQCHGQQFDACCALPGPMTCAQWAGPMTAPS